MLRKASANASELVKLAMRIFEYGMLIHTNAKRILIKTHVYTFPALIVTKPIFN